MKPFSQVTFLVIAASLAATALDLAGTVTNPDGTPRAGVTVSLASGGAVATTDASGKWAIGSGSVGMRGRIRRQAGSSHLAVDGGR